MAEGTSSVGRAFLSFLVSTLFFRDAAGVTKGFAL